MRRFEKFLYLTGTLVFGLGLFSALFAQQPVPQLPERIQPTIQDLKDQIADCAINTRSQSQYESKLIERIKELEKQLADLKTPKLPSVESKTK